MNKLMISLVAAVMSLAFAGVQAGEMKDSKKSDTATTKSEKGMEKKDAATTKDDDKKKKKAEAK